MASLADADVHLTLSASQSQLRIAQAHRRLLPLRLQAGGPIGGRLDPPLCVLFRGLGRVRQGRLYPTVSQPAGSPPCPGDAVRRPGADEARQHLLPLSAALPDGVAWPCWIAPGTDASWSSGSKGSTEVSGGVPTRRSSSGRPAWPPEDLVLVKFWLQIREDQQLRRFGARERDPLKRWKLTGEDWRNLSHRADYEEAGEEMLAKTDRSAARWHVVAGESKPTHSSRCRDRDRST